MHCLIYRWIGSGSWLHTAMPFLPVFQRDAPHQLLQGINTLLNASLAESSKGTYRRAWCIFNEFSIGLFGQVMHQQLYVSTIALFLAYLHNLYLSYKTINTYLSALAYVHKILKLPNPTNQFLITRLIKV